MRLIHPSFEVLDCPPWRTMLRLIEKAGRTAYKSEAAITGESCVAFVKQIIKSGHLSVIEHQSAMVKFIVDRGVSHELVRHRLCAFTQESTRYCDYVNEGKFEGGHITFIIPVWCSSIQPGTYDVYDQIADEHGWIGKDAAWADAMITAERHYKELRTERKDGFSVVESGWRPEEARSVLPNSLKTEIVVTANMREWRHILTLRTSPKAHPQMQQIMNMLLAHFKRTIPILFDDIGEPLQEGGCPTA